MGVGFGLWASGVVGFYLGIEVHFRAQLLLGQLVGSREFYDKELLSRLSESSCARKKQKRKEAEEREQEKDNCF